MMMINYEASIAVVTRSVHNILMVSRFCFDLRFDSSAGICRTDMVRKTDTFKGKGAFIQVDGPNLYGDEGILGEQVINRQLARITSSLKMHVPKMFQKCT